MNDGSSGLVAAVAQPALVEQADRDARAEPALAARQLDLAEQRPQQRGLAGAVRADDGEAVLPRHLEVDRAEPERAELHHRRVEPGDHVAGAGGGLQLELELPRLPRLVDDLEPLDGLLGGLDLRRPSSRSAAT